MPITKCLVALEPQKPVVQATNGKIEIPVTKCLVALEPQKPVVQATNGKIEIPGTLSNNITFRLF